MGTAGGKLGNMVLFRAGGQERQRAYVSTVANPQTDAQMRTRIRFRSAGHAFRLLRPATERMSIAKVGTTRYNAFVSDNWALAPYVTKNPDMLPYAPWIVSNGNLLATAGAVPAWASSSTTWAAAGWQSKVWISLIAEEIPKADIIALRAEAGFSANLVKLLLTLIWQRRGWDLNYHLCVTHADGVNTDMETSIPLTSSAHAPLFAEVWPSSPYVEGLGDAQLIYNNGNITPWVHQSSNTTGTQIIDPLGGTSLFGWYLPASNGTTSGLVASLALYIDDINDDDEQNPFYPVSIGFAPQEPYSNSTPSAERNVMWAAWMADGITNNTGRGVIQFLGSGQQFYDTNVSERAFTGVLPYWVRSGEAADNAVYPS